MTSSNAHLSAGDGQLNVSEATQQVPLTEDELDRAEEKAWWDSLTPEEQRAYEAKHEADLRMVEEREVINDARQDFYDRIYKDLYNVDALLQQLLEWAEEAGDEEDAQWHRENNATLTLDEKLEFVADEYTNRPSHYEAELRATNLVTPFETMTTLAAAVPLSDTMIATMAKRHRSLLKLGIEDKALNFRRRPKGGYSLNDEQQQYVRKQLLKNYTRIGKAGSAQMLVAIYEPTGMWLLEPRKDGDGNGFTWDTVNLDDYRAGFLFPLSSNMPTGGFAPRRDRVEFLCLLLKKGVITLERFWERLRSNSYIADRDEFFEDGVNSLVMTKRNWRNLVHKAKLNDTAEDPQMIPTDWAFVDAADERLGFWSLSEWEEYIASKPDDWFVVGEDIPEYIGQDLEPTLLLPEMLEWHQRHMQTQDD